LEGEEGIGFGAVRKLKSQAILRRKGLVLLAVQAQEPLKLWIKRRNKDEGMLEVGG